MTVADNTSRNQYTATSGQTVFAYTFEIVDKDDIVVLKNGTTLSEGTNYTVSNVGNDSGGNVTLTVGATTGDILTLYRDMPYSRTQNYTNSGDFLASEVNSDFDNLWLAGEQTQRSFSQSIRKPITDSDSISMELPEAASRAGKFLQFDSAGAVNVTPGGGTASLSRQQFTGDGSTTAFTLSAAPDADGGGLQIYIDGVYQESTTYSVSGSTLTFTEAPPLNSGIEVVKLQAEELGSTTSNLITYTPAGTGAVDTTVQTKLRESVSVKDFGAVGDGVTDDTAAIQAALDAGDVIVIPYGTYICHGLTCAGKTIVSESATLKQKTGDEDEAVLTFTGTSRLQGHLDVDLNTGIRAEDVVQVNGVHTYVESIYIYNGTNDAGAFYAFSILAGDVVAGSIRTNAAGYAGISIDSSADIDRVAIDYVESIDFFYKGFRCNGDVEEIVIDKMVAKTSFTNTGEDGFLIDTGVSGNEVQSLSIGSYISDGATANNMKLAEGTKDVNIGSVFINNAQAPTETYAFNIVEGDNVSINNITINNATASFLLNIRSLVRNFNCNSLYTNSAADTYVVRIDGGASGVINANFGSIVIDNNTKTNGSFRLEGFSGQELHCNIGMFYSSTDERPLNIQALPANAGAVTIQNMIGFTSANYTGSSNNNIVLNKPMPRKQLHLSAVPTAGTFVTGDIIFDSTPSAGGHIGWVCTAGGTPGTWKTFGSITA